MTIFSFSFHGQTRDSRGAQITIDVTQPVIILLSPEEAGSLFVEPVTFDEERRAVYWKSRALVYRMSKHDER